MAIPEFRAREEKRKARESLQKTLQAKKEDLKHLIALKAEKEAKIQKAEVFKRKKSALAEKERTLAEIKASNEATRAEIRECLAL